MTTQPKADDMADDGGGIGYLYEALSKAQGEMKHAKRERENPFFKSSYADLASIIDACKAPLAKHGLAVIQTTRYEGDGTLVLQTRLVHSSGCAILSEMPVRPVKDDPQGVGSALTYARRYSWASIVGVVAEGEDDDGEGATGRDRGTGPEGDRHQSYTTSTDRPPKKAGAQVPPCPKHGGKDVIWSKKTPGAVYCFKCKGEIDPNGPQNEPGAAEAAEAFE